MNDKEQAKIASKILNGLMESSLETLSDYQSELENNDAINILYSVLIRYTVEIICRIVIFTNDPDVIIEFLQDASTATLEALENYNSDKKVMH